jgi:hypothetical protein
MPGYLCGLRDSRSKFIYLRFMAGRLLGLLSFRDSANLIVQFKHEL